MYIYLRLNMINMGFLFSDVMLPCSIRWKSSSHDSIYPVRAMLTRDQKDLPYTWYSKQPSSCTIYNQDIFYRCSNWFSLAWAYICSLHILHCMYLIPQSMSQIIYWPCFVLIGVCTCKIGGDPVVRVEEGPVEQAFVLLGNDSYQLLNVTVPICPIK